MTKLWLIFTLFFSLFLSAQPTLTPCQVLHYAVMTNNYNLSWRVMDKAGVRANCRDEQGNTAIHIFARYGTDTKMLALLLYRGFGRLNKKNNASETPAEIAHKYKNRSSLINIIGFANPLNPITVSDDILRSISSRQEHHKNDHLPDR